VSAAVLVGIAASVAAAAAVAAPAPRCQVEGPAQRTASRTFVLHVLPAEEIFTKAEAAAGERKKGEVILRGALPRGARTATPAKTHVSVHVLDRRTGRAVWEPYPIRLRLGKVAETRPLPVALMQGIGKGACDRHYGTNVKLESGQPYTLTATLGRDTVTFRFEAGTGHAGHGG
jgi:hypothetical protein